jgi:ribosomal protein L32
MSSDEEVEMDCSTFEAADLVVDEIADKLDEHLDSDHFAAIRVRLARLSEKVGPRYSANLNVFVEVFDAERPNAVPLLMLGLSASDGGTPYKTYWDSTPQKYVVDGEIEVVPHDRCPKCYGLWNFKLDHPSCSECGVTMGREVKLLVDTDVCCFCEDGTVSPTAPVCDKCGQQIYPGWVVWG